MPEIHVLSQQTANLIAAGEVVERPANVIKELLENAIDAGADQITAEILGGGLELIRVSDNGRGMARDDLPLAVKRHATSKIRDEEDLVGIQTLGFRGEALAAISSTSRFVLISKRKLDPVGYQMTCEGETVFPVEECGAADGTTVLVRDLFFNQPARKKFLKRPATEAAAVLQYVERLAVSHPEIAFKFLSDGVTKLQTVGNGKLDECLWSVYGKEFADAIVPLKTYASPYRFSGFITRPELARSNRNYQSFYINKRFVKSKTLSFAVEDAYKSFVKSEKFPGCIIFLETDPKSVDINVHPSKLEVRFGEEREVYNALFSAVRKTLSELSNAMAREAYETALEKKEPALPTIGEKKPYVPVKSVNVSIQKDRQRGDFPIFAHAVPKKEPFVAPEDRLKKDEFQVKTPVLFPETESPKTIAAPPETNSPESARQEILPEAKAFPEESPSHPLFGGIYRGVIFDAFILYETEKTVYLIDKHAAHERILYEELKNKISRGAVQMRLEPLLIRLSPLESAALSENLAEMNEAGFVLDEFGSDAFLLRGVPMELTRLSDDDFIRLLSDSAKELSLGGKGGGAKDKLFDRTLYSMACKAAVKAGIPTSDQEHEYLIKKLLEMDNVIVCPHGRPILAPFTRKQIENLFLRT